jgi:hypothetical protein
MGYRSDVAAIFYVEHLDQLPLLQLFVEENFPFDEFEGNMKHIDSDYVHGYEFRTHDTKWYDSNEGVQMFDKFTERFVGLADEKDGKKGGYLRNWAYEFIRLGEDSDDIERESSEQCYGLLDLSRQIEIDYTER